ncbi:putative beta-lactamase [Pseudonocardia sp. Ae706_Ps2]|uniref:MBL fold metallo-hydrolase n=1 Tax=unclassified Pseudonocardia TaxID=2619320 RepID=UPI000968DF15|nr:MULTISPECIES: MBL fold metallo-hydrolase [unclassified Pseudonocardia]OLM06619.1 putative beta-lactamase [Pseudonocardia sp. Ae331_Ps2]OLM23150.1 putative beta-lactamase [Pseudonocardia sp. Ae706_Ps2]OLM32223.1 putative beta-lactamase [Pseudonocardia sp. Ae717_Ps2]
MRPRPAGPPLVEQVDRGTVLVTGTDVNWVLLREGDALTLVDGGYPGDVAAVEFSIATLGLRPQDVVAILVTHAHVDHLGAVNPFHARYGTPVLLHPVEVAHARRERREQLTPARVVAGLWRPAVLPWAVRVARAGAGRDVAAAHAQPFPTSGALDLPGSPVPVPTGGHTSGHTAFHLPASGAVITGDSLVTGHALSPATGPQLLPAWFNHGTDEEMRAALGALAGVDADLLLPGHGPAHRGPLRAAVDRAAGAPPGGGPRTTRGRR